MLLQGIILNTSYREVRPDRTYIGNMQFDEIILLKTLVPVITTVFLQCVLRNTVNVPILTMKLHTSK